MAVTVVALTTIFSLIALGFGLPRLWLDEQFWRPAEDLTYFVLVPA